MFTLIYTHLVLYWQYVLGNDGAPIELNIFGQNCCPEVQQVAQGVVDIVNGDGGLGNMTPDKAYKICKDIIDEDGLGCQLRTQ